MIRQEKHLYYVQPNIDYIYFFISFHLDAQFLFTIDPEMHTLLLIVLQVSYAAAIGSSLISIILLSVYTLANKINN